MSEVLYILLGLVIGFIVAFLLQTSRISGLNKELKSKNGLLEAETLRRENTQKENFFLIQSADAHLIHTKEMLAKSKETIKIMDGDILLLQRSNEETEALLAKGESAIPELKLRLIEAQNTIARMKGNNQ